MVDNAARQSLQLGYSYLAVVLRSSLCDGLLDFGFRVNGLPVALFV